MYRIIFCCLTHNTFFHENKTMKNSDLCETQTLNYRCTGKHKVFFQFLDILRQTTMYPNSENEQINFLGFDDNEIYCWWTHTHSDWIWPKRKTHGENLQLQPKTIITQRAGK